MQLFDRDLDKEVVVIAEIGVNHEGDVDVAAKLLVDAAKAGADAVKFQSYTPERFVGVGDPERLARVTKFGLNEAAHRRLARVAAESKIAFFSSAITEDWVLLIAELSPAIKIASGDLTFEPVIAAAARTGKPVVLSTGAGTAEEVDQAVDWFKAAAGTQDVSQRLALLHCVSGYPTPVEEINLLSIPFMAKRYGLTVGWSNHVIGPDACIAAVALGAPIIEVHVTDRRNGRTFRDHSLSFECSELATLVKSLRAIRKSLGKPGKEPAGLERDIQMAIRKGVVAARDIAAGELLKREDLMFARPATEFASNDVSRLLGATALRDVGKGVSIARDAVRLKG